MKNFVNKATVTCEFPEPPIIKTPKERVPQTKVKNNIEYFAKLDYDKRFFTNKEETGSVAIEPSLKLFFIQITNKVLMEKLPSLKYGDISYKTFEQVMTLKVDLCDDNFNKKQFMFNYYEVNAELFKENLERSFISYLEESVINKI